MEAAPANRVGIVFLNPGFMPRAASGDAAVYWADAFARCGYPAFRIDLPGLGDSAGDLPVEVADFVSLVNVGHYAPLLSSAVKELAERFKLPGMVVVGHCAGAVSAIYTAAASNEVKGLVLLDPYFYLGVQESTNLRERFRLWVTRNRLAGYISTTYGRLKNFGGFLRGTRFPKNANLQLIRCWNQVALAGLAILVLKAPTPTLSAEEFDYLPYLQRMSHRRDGIAVRDIGGTDHAFVKGPGKEAVREHTEQWLSTHFPVRACEENGASDSHRPLDVQVA